MVKNTSQPVAGGVGELVAGGWGEEGKAGGTPHRR